MKLCADCGQATPTPTQPHRAILCSLCKQTREKRRNEARSWYAGYWKRISADARRQQPWCSACGATGVPLEVDHIKPRSTQGGLRVLCQPCHRNRTR